MTGPVPADMADEVAALIADALGDRLRHDPPGGIPAAIGSRADGCTAVVELETGQQIWAVVSIESPR